MDRHLTDNISNQYKDTCNNKIETNKPKEDNNNSVENNENTKDYNIEIVISASKLKVYLRVITFNENAIVESKEIFKKLKELGVVYGIKEQDIIQYCKEKKYYKEIVIAEGLAPKHSENAYIEYNFKLDDTIEFKEKEDGTVDFKSINNIRAVSRNGLICKKIPVKEGHNGMDVFGTVIPHNNGKDVELPTGKNVYASKDGLELYAFVDGCICKRGKSIDVDNVYTVQCVDHSTGNIDFCGSVVVKEDVKSGFTVKAQDDIIVRGMVEGATLEAGRDIVLNNGMNGRDVGVIKANGNITSKYLENATVIAKKSVYSNAIINCNIQAGEDIYLKGTRGAIIGGICQAGQKIQAKTIGTKNNISTKIVIDLERYLEIENSKNKNQGLNLKIKNSIEKKQEELEEVVNKINYVAPLAKKSSTNDKVYKLLILKKAEIKKEINDLKKLLIEQDSSNKKITDHKIICSGILYANTRIVIGWLKYQVRDDLSYVKLYNDGSEIQITPLLPSDLS